MAFLLLLLTNSYYYQAVQDGTPLLVSVDCRVRLYHSVKACREKAGWQGFKRPCIVILVVIDGKLVVNRILPHSISWGNLERILKFVRN